MAIAARPENPLLAPVRSRTAPSTPQAPAGETACFHCGLPLPAEGTRYATLDGTPRAFCCPGCEAVALAIVGQGLGDYYRVRESLPERPDDAKTGPIADLAVYDDPAVQAAFVREGEGAEREASLILEGIRCSACVWLNEQTLVRLPGVIAADINYATHRARIRWDADRVRLSRILEAIAGIGYRAYPYEPKKLDEIRQAENRSALWRLFVAGFGMMQVMMYAIPVYLAEDGTMTGDIEALMHWASLILTLPVVLYSAQPFFRGAWRDLRVRRLGMDVPVALGIAVAFGVSAWATVVGHGEVYFDSVAMFVFFLLAGRYLELRARHRAAGALQYLSRLVPEVTDRLVDYPASLATESIAVSRLEPGDRVLVRPGASLPADGTVESGDGGVDESLLTGESRPVAKGVGSMVVGGSVNLSSPLVVRVEQVGSETVLSAIVRLVERATAEKQRIVELADRAAHWFVLVILAIAFAAWLGWTLVDPARALWIAVAVLVVTCPCALSLATPVALTAATGELARRGFVVTRGHTIEALARATDVVFDKTGTLTRGELRVLSVRSLGGEDEADCLRLAASLEQGSEHPVARAILAAAAASETGLEMPDGLVNVPGQGVEGVIAGRRYRLGTSRFVSALAGKPGDGEATGEDAHSWVWLADDRGLLARFEIGDALRPEAREVIESLQRAGKRVHLLSGDAAGPVAAAARAVGISRYEAEATPTGKQDYLRVLQAGGARVAMVGDGINDAPVLASADVSIAMATGAHLSQTQADAVLLTADLRDLEQAFRSASRTLQVIRQNLAWALGYNVIAVPLAVAGFVTPWLAGIGMSASSLIVVLNALRLREFRRGDRAKAKTRSDLAVAA